VSDIDTAVVDSLKALDPEWPIREADMSPVEIPQCSGLRYRKNAFHLVGLDQRAQSFRSKGVTCGKLSDLLALRRVRSRLVKLRLLRLTSSFEFF